MRVRLSRLLIVALLASLLALPSLATGAGAGARAGAGAVAAATTTGPCRGSAAPPAYRHVVVIWLENHGYDAVLGRPRDWPWLDRTLVPACGLLTRYQATGHPSLGNYLVATSGRAQGLGATTNCLPAQCPQTQPSVFAAVQRAGLTWRAYAEGLPRPCARTPAGQFAPKHVPALYYRDVAGQCADHVLGLDAFGRDLAAGRLPSYAVVTPDECHDAHSCPAAVADAWLRTWVGRVTSSPDYRRGDTALLLAWDEGGGGGAQSLHVPAVVVAPSVPAGLRSSAATGHLGQLQLVEQLLGLPGGRPELARALHLTAGPTGRRGR